LPQAEAGAFEITFSTMSGECPMAKVEFTMVDAAAITVDMKQKSFAVYFLWNFIIKMMLF
jgi:hypothetical protein